MIDLIPRKNVAHQPLLQQEVSAHGVGDDPRDFRIGEFNEGVASRASRLGGARDAAAIDVAELIEEDGDLALFETDGEVAEVDDSRWLIAVVGRWRLGGSGIFLITTLFSFVAATLARGCAFSRYGIGISVYLIPAFRIFRIFILGGTRNEISVDMYRK